MRRRKQRARADARAAIETRPGNGWSASPAGDGGGGEAKYSNRPSHQRMTVPVAEVEGHMHAPVAHEMYAGGQQEGPFEMAHPR